MKGKRRTTNDTITTSFNFDHLYFNNSSNKNINSTSVHFNFNNNTTPLENLENNNDMEVEGEIISGITADNENSTSDTGYRYAW